MDNIDVNNILDKLLKDIKLNNDEIDYIWLEAKNILILENNIVFASIPFFIVGSLFGNYDCLEELILTIEKSSLKIIFLGNYFNRGSNSIKVFFRLLLLKIKYPNQIYLIRGMHECNELTKLYGLYKECKKIYNVNVYNKIMDMAKFLLIGVLWDNKILCWNSGIPIDIKSIFEINLIDRKKNILDDEFFMQFFYNDPLENDSDDLTAINNRGNGYYYNKNIFHKFMDINNLSLIIRSNEILENGFKYYFNHRLLSIFSTPNFSFKFDNIAIFLYINNKLNISFYNIKNISKNKNLDLVD